MLAGLFWVFLAWVISAVVLIGLGSLVLNLFSREYRLTDSFWTGLALAVSALQVWHFFKPVNSAASLALILLGTVGIVRHRSRLAELLRIEEQVGVWGLLVYFVILISIAFRALGPCEHFDTGLYGAGALRWTLTYPVVPGLANLHHRFGFNSSCFLSIAALGQGPWRDVGHHLLAGLLVAAFWSMVGPRMLRILRSGAASATDWFHAMLFVPAAYWTTHSQLVGTMTDLPACIVGLAGASILFCELESKSLGDDSSNRGGRVRILTAILLFSLATTMKLSLAVMALLATMVGIALLWRHTSVGTDRWKWVGGSILFCSLLIVPWLLRSVVLTGYPLYPSTVLGAPVSWKVSPSLCQLDSAEIKWWARRPFVPAEEARVHGWFQDWFRRNIVGRESLQVPLALSVLGLTGIGSILYRTRSKILGEWGWLWILPPSLAGIVFWFLSAPAPRFGEASIWTTAASLGTVAIFSFVPPHSSLSRQRLVCLGVILLGGWCIAPHRLWSSVYKPLLSSARLLPLPKASVAQVTTRHGLAIHWRIGGQQCWDASIPCTPFFDDTLRLRRVGELASGFISDWNHSDTDGKPKWPNPDCIATSTCKVHILEPESKDHGGE
jgi:hypothetical protein